MLAALAVLAWARTASAEAAGLHVDWRNDLAATAAAGGIALTLASPGLAPGRCRLCGVGGFDAELREVLRITDPAEALRARRVSDVLVSGVLPGGALALSGLLAREDGTGWRGAGENALVITETLGLAAVLNGVAKDGFARRRPAGGDALQPGSRNRSFYSGHTSTAFALAAASGTVASLRGSEATPWIWGAGMTLATTVGYLRIAGDAHWGTDVLVGAAMGGGVGVLVPWLHRGRGRGGLEIVPALRGRGLGLKLGLP
ncbi:MAG TPA: phosphatase PAP2 family protein [Anaeromyxobacteraceae bacterium]|nr:phosphatase PAP2 family protein [Anaeromyxobacteraceae bacterium]